MTWEGDYPWLWSLKSLIAYLFVHMQWQYIRLWSSIKFHINILLQDLDTDLPVTHAFFFSVQLKVRQCLSHCHCPAINIFSVAMFADFTKSRAHMWFMFTSHFPHICEINGLFSTILFCLFLDTFWQCQCFLHLLCLNYLHLLWCCFSSCTNVNCFLERKVCSAQQSAMYSILFHSTDKLN